MKFHLPPESWGRVIVATFAGTVVCILTAFYVDSFNFDGMNEATKLRAMASDLLIPTVLAVPIIFFLMSKLRELAIAHQAGCAIMEVIRQADNVHGSSSNG